MKILHKELGALLNEGNLSSIWQSAERHWISFLKGEGYQIVNGTDGGEGDPLPEHVEFLARFPRAVGDRNPAAVTTRISE